MKRTLLKNIVAITLAAVGILSAGAAEATPVTNGFYHTTAFQQDGMFSGANFAVNLGFIGGGVFGINSFNAGTINGGVGVGTIFTGLATVQIGNDSCTAGPGENCGAMLTFMFAPGLLPTVPSTADAPFTMSGLLRVGNVTLDIEGSGFLHATSFAGPGGGEVRFDFAVAEPSTVVLVLSGLVTVAGWSRWRGGKRAG